MNGYKALKCDFDFQSIISGGLLWTTIRVDEAVKDDLDAIFNHPEWITLEKDGIPQGL